MGIPFIQKSSLLLLSPPPGGSLTESRRFSLTHPPLCKITVFFGNQRVIGVVGLHVVECLNIGPLFVVPRQVTYPKKGSQHWWLSGHWNIAVILHKGGCTNKKRLFSVKEPPGGVDSSRRLFLFNKWYLHILIMMYRSKK